jgi:hypothetical protein
LTSSPSYTGSPSRSSSAVKRRQASPRVIAQEADDPDEVTAGRFLAVLLPGRDGADVHTEGRGRGHLHLGEAEVPPLLQEELTHGPRLFGRHGRGESCPQNETAKGQHNPGGALPKLPPFPARPDPPPRLPGDGGQTSQADLAERRGLWPEERRSSLAEAESNGQRPVELKQFAQLERTQVVREQ